MYSFVTSRAISMKECGFLLAGQIRRIVSSLTLAGIVACGSAENMNTAGKSRETKDNMSVERTTAPGDAATVDSASKTVRTPVVLFFGTSLTAGYGLAPEQAFPSLIEKKAREDGV